MPRREFPASVRVAAAKRATGLDGIMRCEHRGCSAVLVPGRWQLDHIVPDSLLGQPVLANSQCLCEACWGAKNPRDTRDAAKAKRREAAHLGAALPSAKPLQSAGFPKLSRKRERHPMPSLPPRPLFVEIDR